MNKPRSTLSILMIASILFLAACSGTATTIANTNPAADQGSPALAQASATNTPGANSPLTSSSSNAPAAQSSGLLSSYQSALENIYTQVNPSVVNIQVMQPQTASSQNLFPFPFFNNPGQQGTPNQATPAPQFSEALGSGFVWDKQGDIVTNNHVVAGASSIQVTFSDGQSVSAKLVGADPYSDLAVVKVDVPASSLNPVQLADSSQVKVGQVAIAIGNPFGLQNTMTAGIVSAVGRILPVSQESLQGNQPSSGQYSIPDVIQTDAPINPGNSGGVLVNDQGQVLGVTSAIESPVQANSGIGFVIPSNIVKKVVPSLIKSGSYKTSYLGISGTDLTPDLDKAMNLGASQRGALIETVVPNGPADQAGLKGSSQQVTISGQTVAVGGDVITAINGQPVNGMDDLISYLFSDTQVGQKVSLTILRDGQQMSVDVTLAARPAPSQPQQTQTQNNQAQSGSGAYLGIVGTTMNSDIAQAMNLPANQEGVLVEQIQAGGPAAQAGIQGSFKPLTVNGQTIMTGGDVIIAYNGQTVSQLSDLQAMLQESQPGEDVTLTVLRDGSQTEIHVTLGTAPTQTP
jgi:serine protease Do